MKFTLYPPQAIHELGKRENQEDAIYPKKGKATDRDRLFILCDGMGGHEKGEVASNTVSKAMAEYLDKNASADEVVSDDVLLAALEYAYKQLDAIDDGAAKKMGTTLCLLLFHRGGLTAMHIGDSRIYHIRPAEHNLLYQSKDHSLVYDLYQAGEITYDEMRTSPQKNIITRAIQPGEENRVRPSIVHITDIKAGDYFYICSDGMLEQMSNEELCGLFSAKGSDEKKKKLLIAATADNKDNHSAYFIHIKNVVNEEGDDNLLNDEQTSTDNALNIRPHVEEPDANSVTVITPAINNVQQFPSPSKQTSTKKPPRSRLAMLVGLCAVVLLILGVVVIKPFGEKKEEKPLEENFDKNIQENKLQGSENNYGQQRSITRQGKRAATTTKRSSSRSGKNVKGTDNKATNSKPGQQQTTFTQKATPTTTPQTNMTPGTDAKNAKADGTKTKDQTDKAVGNAKKAIEDKFKRSEKNKLNDDPGKDVKNGNDNDSNV